MGNQNGKKWYDFIVNNIFTQISIAVMAVFGEDEKVNVDRPVFIDPKKRTKVFLEAENGTNGDISWILKKLNSFSPEYHEINIRFPKGSKLARKSETKPFDIRNEDKGFGYCFLRIQPSAFFEGVFVKIGRWNYKVSVIENPDTIEVILWNNPKDIPDCLR
ncbi:MAG: hypothetical protein PHE77_03070 [Candidatus Pacebacteria bacterium]|nr:hypothetical protein [Candidatus Paceibacterota bacterium]